MRIARLVGKSLSAAVLVGLYFIAGKLGLMLAFLHPSATPIWAPTGIAIAAFLVKGPRLWPAILAGAFLVNITTAGTAVTSFGIALGNTLEGLAGAWLVTRFANGCEAFDRPQDVFKFAALAGMLSPIVSATLGVTSLSLGGFAEWARYETIWFTWWLGDSVGALTVGPLLVLLANPGGHWNRRQVLEGVFLLAVLFLVGQTVFGGWLPTQAKNYPLSFLCFPLLVWPAFRFGQRETAVAACFLSAVAIWGTLGGFGPFVREAPNESLLLLQAFMGVTTVMAIALAATVAESRRAHEAATRLAKIVESSHDGIVSEATDGTILSWNAGAAGIFGYTREEVEGRSIAILTPPGRSAEARQIQEQIRHGKGVDHFETVRVRKGGAPITVSLTISPLRDATGRIVGACTIARDITTQKRAEEAARRTEALESVRDLANAAAHEINNPLAVILGHVDLVERKQEDDPEKSLSLHRIAEAAERIHAIVARMQRITGLTVVNPPPGLPQMLDLKASTDGHRKEAEVAD